MFRKVILFFLVLPWILFSCGSNESVNKIDESDLPKIDFKIKRYGKALFELDTNNLSNELKSIGEEYRIFLGDDLDNEKNIHQIYDFVSDTALIRIYKKSIEVYPDDEFINNEIGQAFRHYKYYYPNNELPLTYSYISGLAYENPVLIKDNIMIIALDMYLGADFNAYKTLGLPMYKIRWMQPNSLKVDVMKEVYNTNISIISPQKTLLDRMISGAKVLYFLDKMLADCPDELKIYYTTEQLKWAFENEKKVWAFLIENDLLFTRNYQLQSKLISDAPFTTGFSRESPSRLGIWIGWQILRDYMERNPEVTLDQLFNNTDSQEILQESGYKP